jgi:hypothetical protein
LAGETPFSEKTAWLQYRNDGLFTLRRNYTQLDFAHLDIEHGIRRIPLREDNLLFRDLQRRIAIADLIEEDLWVKRRHRCDSQARALLLRGLDQIGARDKAGGHKDLLNQTSSYRSPKYYFIISN